MVTVGNPVLMANPPDLLKQLSYGYSMAYSMGTVDSGQFRNTDALPRQKAVAKLTFFNNMETTLCVCLRH